MRRRPPTARKPGSAPPGRVRIVAGKWRGRFLEVADVPELRPTSERIRETLFNWLAPRIEGAQCLDLFAGSGVLGLEALSRGAAEVHLVERNPQALRTLRLSIVKLGADHATVHAVDAFAFLESAAPLPQDIVFLDPPYSLTALGDLCAILDSKGWLAPGAFVYLEQDSSTAPFALPHGWTMRREKKAGNVRYSLIEALAP